MKAVGVNDVVHVVINGVKFGIRKFRGYTTMGIGAAVISTLAPVAPLIGALLGEGDAADMDMSSALSSLGLSLMKLEPKKIVEISRELLEVHGNVSYELKGEYHSFTESSVDDTLDGNPAHIVTLILEVLKINYGGLFTMLGDQFGNRAQEEPEDEQVQSLI
jgi:hypothetical protein